MIYLYGLVRGGAPAPASAGLGGARVTLTEAAGVAALHSRHRTLDLEPDATKLWTHESVLEAAMAHGPVLPCRFGTTLADEADVAAMLHRSCEDIGRGLDVVEGRVEMAVRARLPEAALEAPEETPTATPASGRSYLESRLRSHRREAERRNRAAPVAHVLHVGLHSAAVDSVVNLVSSPAPGVVAAYLVQERSRDHFLALADALAHRRPDLDITCTGPWPPYSFVPDLTPTGLRLAGERL